MMRYEFEVIYDWHDSYGFFPDEENTHQIFIGTSEELGDFVRVLRECGGRNIFFHSLREVGEQTAEEPDDIEEEYEDPWERELIRSVTGGYYNSANPWDAPGMGVSDFI